MGDQKTACTGALLRNPSRIGVRTILTFGSFILEWFNERSRATRDECQLQRLPDRVLADIGLERMEILPGTDGRIKIIPRRPL
jgi:uncharacterized protein YjiS (DUF1127 family)